MLGVILKMKLVERGVQGGISSYSEGYHRPRDSRSLAHG
jgi:hypothetical protein